MRNAVGNFCPWEGVVSSTLLRCAAFAQAAYGTDDGV